MRRRELIKLLAGLAAVAPTSTRVVQAGTLARVGFIGLDRQIPLGGAIYQAFRDEMQKRGFTEGQNLIVEFRSIEQDASALSSDALGLVRLHVDVIVAAGTEAAVEAAVGASRTLPVVMIATNFDPIAHGFIKSLARPGGNVTGVFLRQTELAEKQTELLTQAVPEGKRMAVLWDSISADQFHAAERRAEALRVTVSSLQLIKLPYDFDEAFRTLVKSSPDMLLVLSSPHFTASRSRIAELAIRYRLPTMFIFKTYTEAGGLMSYGADYEAMHRQIAGYVAKILMGARPVDLPVEQPNRFELVANLKTAKAIGIELPMAILERADEVIE